MTPTPQMPERPFAVATGKELFCVLAEDELMAGVAVVCLVAGDASPDKPCNFESCSEYAEVRGVDSDSTYFRLQHFMDKAIELGLLVQTKGTP